MKVGDRVEVKDVPGTASFRGKQGEIMDAMNPDYEWAVLIDDTEDPDDTWGFNECELKVIS